MAIQFFHPEDEVDNLLRGLRLLEQALRGVASNAQDSVIDPEEHLEPIVMLVQALQDHVRNIQRITGCVVFEGPRKRARTPSPAQA